MSYHSPLAPSSAHRWMHCPGSVAMARTYPELPGDTDAADAGTVAHWVAAELFAGRVPAVGTVAGEHGAVVTEEMIECGQYYVRQLPPDAMLEHRVQLDAIHPECWGTPDAYHYDPEARLLQVWDYKFGHGYVDHAYNPQLISYAAGLLDRYPEATLLALTVVQPRCYSGAARTRTHGLDVADPELRCVIGRLQLSADRAWRMLGEEDAPDPLLCNPGEWCKYCPARAQCPALAAAVGHCVDLAQLPHPDAEPSPAMLAYQLDQLERAATLVGALRDGLAQLAEHRLRSGEPLPGWRMAPGRSRTDWAVPVEDVAALAAVTGLELVCQQPVTPKQAEAALKKAGLAPSVIRGYITATPGAMRLERDNINTLTEVFKNGSN